MVLEKIFLVGQLKTRNVYGHFVRAKRFQKRGYLFLEIDQPETRMAYSGHVC
jgi:hypothetical protein